MYSPKSRNAVNVTFSNFSFSLLSSFGSKIRLLFLALLLPGFGRVIGDYYGLQHMTLMTIVLKDVGSKFDLFFFGLRSGTEALNSAKLPF